MKIVAIDFSSPQMSVAVGTRENTATTMVLSEIIETGTRAGNALGMIEAALREARVEREQIECLAIGLGPGSYSGIRTSIALAQGWQLARPIKLLGISSAECLAAQAQAEGLVGSVTTVIDAQRNELYVATWEITGRSRAELRPLRLCTITELKTHESPDELLVGPEITKWFPGGRLVFPRASMLARLGLEKTDFISADALQPIYLRETAFVKAPPPRIFS